MWGVRWWVKHSAEWVRESIYLHRKANRFYSKFMG